MTGFKRVRGGTLLCLSGPTAVGKSEVALLLAERLNGEIVSVDSMQVYRGLDIGTAKATPEERARIPHHLIDVVDVTEPFDAAKFVKLAGEVLPAIEARGRLAILCGGTGLYLAALFGGLGGVPPGDAAVRAELDRVTLPDLLEELRRFDPATYAAIDRGNRRRVLRAVEVWRLSRRPLSLLRARWQTSRQPPAESPVVFALTRTRESLRARIDARVERMFAQGLVNETASLLARGLAENLSARQAIGYRQVVEHLGGARSLAETVALVKQKTRQMAKRQVTYLRHQLPVTWVDWAEADSASEVAARVESLHRRAVERGPDSVPFPPPEH